jgi:uncharacterized protein (DUF779 family)
MRITATPNAVAVIEQAKAARTGTLTVTIGTGCCESTAPFLYEDFWPGPDQEPIGEVAGVVVYAPDYLRELYPADDAVVLDAHDELAESMSVETEFGHRLILRSAGFDSSNEPEICLVPVEREKTAGVLRPVVGTVPPEMRNLRMR